MAVGVLARDVDTVRRFNRFYTRRIGVLQEKLLQSRFSLTEGRVLFEIGYHGATGALRAAPPTAADIAKALDLDGGYLSRILLRFTRQRLISRRRSTTDKRQAHLVLTARGQKALAPLQRLARDEVAAMIGHLSHADRGRVIDAMSVIQESLDGAGHVLPAAGRALPAPAKTDGEPLPLREHRAGDLGWIVSRQSALYVEEYGWTTEYEAMAADIVSQFLKSFDPQRERCWIAELDGARVGAVMLVKRSDTVAQLRLLHVEAVARGRGVGRRLIAECVRFARDAGYERITLWTQSNLLAARHLYAAAGFACVSRSPHHRFGVDLVAETWELVL